MDDNLSKALIMAGGALLSIILVSFLIFSKNKMSSWGETQDERNLAEQVEKFNKEYEVYDKELMYGVDVISCLNKVLSNNEKISNNRVGENLDKSYEIKVKMTIKKTLEEEIIVYQLTSQKEQPFTQNNGPSGVKIKDAEFSILKDESEYKSKFKNSDDLKSQKIDSEYKNGVYSLTLDKTGENEEKIRSILSSSTAINETKINMNSTTLSLWSKANYKSALYDLKSRKFKCTDFKYNNSTGRVNYIEFEEY